jgi:hypothetical protein
VTVAYLTDVEGMWDRLATFAEGNRALRLDGDRLILADGATFVFGGDAIDRGPWSRRVVRTLLDAKARYGERVVLLAGNRDINKIRLARELHGHPPEKAPPELRERLPELLRWIFEHTMGARGAFEFRREELVAEGRAASDDDVVQSYLDEVAPGGTARRYLAQCTLAFRRGRSLFVHGGLTEESLGTVPGDARIDGVDAWCAKLNAWYRAQLAAFEAHALDDDGRPTWTPLVAYQAPAPGSRTNQKSVVYGRNADGDNNPLLPVARVIEACAAEGIHRVLVGHTPNGDSPSVLRDPARRFELIIADNSYSRLADGSRVIVEDDAVEVSGRTQLDDGRRGEITFTLAHDDATSMIGLRARDGGWLVKGRFTEGDYLLFRYLPGYKIEQIAASESDLRAKALSTPY